MRLPCSLDILHGSFEPAVIRTARFDQALKSAQFAGILTERNPVSTPRGIVGPHADQTIFKLEGFGFSSVTF